MQATHAQLQHLTMKMCHLIQIHQYGNTYNHNTMHAIMSIRTSNTNTYNTSPHTLLLCTSCLGTSYVSTAGMNGEGNTFEGEDCREG
jgi:hypothetical protein